MANHRKYYNKIFTCEQCGKFFERLDKHEYRFCSPRCRALAQGKYLIKHVCEWCGKEFERFPCRQGRFCSNQCRSEFAAHQPKNMPSGIERDGKVSWHCKQCDKIKRTFKSRVRDFCSPKCWGKSILGKSRANYGMAAKTSSYRGENWQKQRKKARERYKYKCQICGEIALDVHHIVKYKFFNGDWSSANNLSNLIVLCEYHHVQVEHNVIPCPTPKQ
jgi:5-methylcytosine-specific restriction endonuclease McrA